MAWHPCEMHHAPYRGAQRTAYPALVDGSVQSRRRLRLCEGCFNELRSFAALHMRPAEEEGEAPPCAICNDAVTDAALFLTLYDKGTEREDWYGRVCVGRCWDELERVWIGSPQR
jgi:hypothetical protein